MSDKPPYWLIAALFLTACADGITPPQPPVALSYVLKPGHEVACVETLLRINIPTTFPFVAWVKRTFTCEVREKSTAVPERIMRDK